MKVIYVLVLAVLALTSCTSDGQRRVLKPTKPATTDKGATSVLFEDDMLGEWQENWFLEGERAVLGHTVEGLWIYCTPSNVDKRVNRAKFDAHHAVLWTKQVPTRGHRFG